MERKQKLASQLPMDYLVSMKRDEATYNGLYATLLNKKGDFGRNLLLLLIPILPDLKKKYVKNVWLK